MEAQEYKKLVEALRCCGDVGCHKCPYQKHIHEHFCWTMAMHDAADAIESLQAENPIVESVLVDKMRQQMEENVCHCNVKENAELIARILDDDVDGKVFELSKRGKWIMEEGAKFTMHPLRNCSVCGSGWFGISGYNYCPSCGAKMEVQE